MLREFLAVVGGQGMGQAGKGSEFSDDGPAHDGGLLARHAFQQRIAALAFVDGHQRLRVACADNQIGLPIAVAFSCVNDGRPLVD